VQGNLIRVERRIGKRRNGFFDLDGVHRDIHGSTILIPHPSKSFPLRVATAVTWDREIAAIFQSGRLIARSVARRSAKMAESSWAAALSNGKTRCPKPSGTKALISAINLSRRRPAGRFKAPRRNSAAPTALKGPRRGDPAPEGGRTVRTFLRWMPAMNVLMAPCIAEIGTRKFFWPNAHETYQVLPVNRRNMASSAAR